MAMRRGSSLLAARLGFRIAAVSQNVPRPMSYLPEPTLSREQVEDRVFHIVKAFPKVDPDKLTKTSHFYNDLGLDSLDAVEIVMGFEQDFHLQIPDADADKIVSVDAAIDFIAAHPMAR